MQYKIETIGSAFSKRDISALEKRFSARALEGYKFHSVFHVRQLACLGLLPGAYTYLAVYVKE